MIFNKTVKEEKQVVAVKEEPNMNQVNNRKREKKAMKKENESSQEYCDSLEAQKNDEMLSDILSLRIMSTLTPQRKQIPQRFTSYDNYIETWSPFFKFECLSSLRNLTKNRSKSKSWKYFTADLSVKNRQEFLSLEMSNINPIDQDERKDIVKSLYHNDLLLLSEKQCEDPFDIFKEPSCHTSDLCKYSFLCSVDHNDNETISLIASPDCGYDIESGIHRIEPKQYFCYFIYGLSSMINEFQAMQDVKSSNFIEKLLNPSPPLGSLKDQNETSVIEQKFSVPVKEIQEVINIRKALSSTEIFRKRFDYSQRIAIQLYTSLNNGSIQLIQGPPATGKTSTILGIISMIIASERPDSQDKILVCAHSNSAIDAIVCRLDETGIFDQYGGESKPNMIRLGSSDNNTNHQIKDYFLEKIVESEMLKRSKEVKQEDKNQSFQIPDTNKIEDEVLRRTKIIISTLCTSGNDLLKRNKFTYSNLIIDEACRATEMSTLIPLNLNVKKVLLIGDHKQLPATVFQEDKEYTKFGRSLFERLHENYQMYSQELSGIYTLNTQYRMHKDLSRFPNDQFYEGILINAKAVTQASRKGKKKILKNLMFFNLEYSCEDQNQSECIESFSNIHEAKFVARAIRDTILLKSGNQNLSICEALDLIELSIKILTPYEKQISVIRNEISNLILHDLTWICKGNVSEASKQHDECMPKIKKIVQIQTIDGSQGTESDIVILSCVRASNNDLPEIGFLKDPRRLNVCLTRANENLWIVGHAKTLFTDPNWKDLICYCYHNNGIDCFKDESTTNKRFIKAGKKSYKYDSFKQMISPYYNEWVKGYLEKEDSVKQGSKTRGDKKNRNHSRKGFKNSSR